MFKYLTIFCLFLSVINVNADKKYKCVTTISPNFLETVKESRPILKWKKYPDAKSYHLRWFEIDPVTRVSIKTKQDIQVQGTEYQFKEDLIPNRVYQWQVEPCDARGRPLPGTIAMCPSFLTGTISKARVEILNNRFNNKRKEIGEILGGRIINAGLFTVPGVWITNIQKGGLAEKYGLKDFDVITKCNKQPIKNVNDLYKQINQSHFGLSLEFVRRTQIPQSAITKVKGKANALIDPAKRKKEAEKLYKKAAALYENKKYVESVAVLEKVLLLDIYNQKAIMLLQKTNLAIDKR